MRYLFAIVTAAAALAAQPVFPQTFEVASVRKHQGTDVLRSGSLTVTGPTIRLTGYTIFGLILDAYHLPASRIRIAPGAVAHVEDIYDTMYDVVARAPGEGRPTIDDVRAMLRGLLADRFDLTTHFDMSERAVYALTAVKGAQALKAASGTTPCAVRAETSADGRNEREAFTSCDMEELADRLTNLLGDRPVLDVTGLTGTFDFSLVAAPAWRTRVNADPADISPLEAVRNLGLKLSDRKAPFKELSVDHLGKLKEN